MLTEKQVEEIREHFCLNTQSINEALIDMFERINFYIDTERSLARMRNKNQMLTYTVSVEKRLDTIAMTFNDLHTQQLVYSNDLRDSNFFSQSAPTDKLSDVIGLERAKKRRGRRFDRPPPDIARSCRQPLIRVYV